MRNVDFGKRFLAVVLLALLAPYGSLGPLAQNQRAGEVAGAIPSGNIERPRGKQTAALGTEVLWDDLVTTTPSGRMRIGLDDGSIINVGSSASLRVIKHDAASQQSNLTLTFGQMRARTKLSKPNASFEVRTNTAVIGVIGTDFWVDAQPTLTRVIVFEGAVRVTSLAGGERRVGSGQMVIVPSGQGPSDPAPASEAEMHDAAGYTDVGTPPLPPPPSERAKSWTHKPWPWVLIGGAVAGTIIAIVVANDDESSSSSTSSSPSP